jgi:hypothetical protein
MNWDWDLIARHLFERVKKLLDNQTLSNAECDRMLTGIDEVVTATENELAAAKAFLAGDDRPPLDYRPIGF